jgi:hydrogenase maturation protease
MKPPLIIAFGNRLRQDDGLGWRAAALLKRTMLPDRVRIIETHQLTPELAADFEDTPLVLFLDAALDVEPGTVITKKISEASRIVWLHDFSPGQLTALAGLLTGLERPVFQVTGGISEIGFSENLTPAGEKSANRMAEAAFQILQEYGMASC